MSTTEEKRAMRAHDDQAFLLVSGEELYTLNDLSEAINLIDPETFHAHVNADKNDFANWVEGVFGLSELAQQLRERPTPLRMMVSIEKYLHA